MVNRLEQDKFKHSVYKTTVDNYMAMKTSKPHTNFITWKCYLNFLDINILACLMVVIMNV